MSIGFLDGDDAARVVAEKMDSREWWIFVGMDLPLDEIEERYYSGDAASDFELFLGPPVGQFRDVFPGVRLLPLMFAHKRRLAAADLARIIRRNGGPADLTAADLEQQDILYGVRDA